MFHLATAEQLTLRKEKSLLVRQTDVPMQAYPQSSWLETIKAVSCTSLQSNQAKVSIFFLYIV